MDGIGLSNYKKWYSGYYRLCSLTNLSKMKPNKINLFRGWIVLSALFVMLMNAPDAKAQDPFPVSSIYLTVIRQSNAMELTAHIILSDTSTISKLHIRIGSMPTLGDIGQMEFAFDQVSGLPQGVTYSRTGTQVTIGLGSFPASQHFFYEAQAEYAVANTSTGSVISYVTAGVYGQ